MDVAERDPLESFLAGVPGLLPKEVEQFWEPGGLEHPMS